MLIIWIYALTRSTLAIIFLLECDNYAYKFGLAEGTRSEAEQFGRAELDTETSTLISRTKAIHTILLTVFIPMSLLPPSITCPGCKEDCATENDSEHVINEHCEEDIQGRVFETE